MRKWIALSCICCIVGVAVFHKQLICFGSKFFLHGAHFSYEEGQWEGKTLSFRRATLETKGGWSATFDRIDLTYDFSLSSPFITSKLTFVRPRISVRRTSSDMRKPVDPYRLLTAHVFKREFEVLGGELQLGDEVAPFSFASRWGKEHVGRFVIGGGEKGEVSIDITRERKVVSATVVAKELSVGWLSSLFGGGFSEGTVDGTLAFSLPKRDTISRVAYDVALSDVTYEKEDVRFSVDRLFMHREEDAFEDHPLFIHKWPYLLCMAKCDAAVANICGVEMALGGILYFEDDQAMTLSVSGEVTHGGEQFPFQMKALGAFGGEDRWRLTCDATSFQELGAPQTLAIECAGGGEIVVQTTFDRLRLDIIAPFFASSGLTVDRGDGSGKACFTFVGNKLVTFDLGEMRVVEACGMWREVAASADEMELSFSYEVARPKDACWHAGVRGGVCELEGHIVRDLEGHIDMRANTIVTSALKGTYQNIPGELWCEGHTSNALAHLTFRHFDWDFAIEAQIKELGSGWKVGGDARIDRGEEEDVIDFSVRIDKKGLFERGIWGGLASGWWKGASIGAPSINVPLKQLGYDWHVTGHFDLDGTFDSRSIDIAFDSRDGGFCSHYVNATLTEGDAQFVKERRKLHYDVVAGKWEGVIPIGRASARVNLLDLEFTDAMATVFISGKHLRADKLTAQAYGTRFDGKVALEFITGDIADVEIRTDRIEGSAQGVLAVVSHFRPVATSLSGVVTSGVDGLFLKTRVGEENGEMEWRFKAHLAEGVIAPTPRISATDLAADFRWDSKSEEFVCSNVQGRVDLSDATYRLNVPSVTVKSFATCAFDARLETPTHDIFRAVGGAAKSEEGIDITLADGTTHLFGSKAHVGAFRLDREYRIERLAVQMAISCHDLINQLVLWTDLGLMDIKDSAIDDLRALDLTGSIDMEIDLSRGGKEVVFRAASEDITCDNKPLSRFGIDMYKRGSAIALNELRLGNLSLMAKLSWDALGLEIPVVEGNYKESFFTFYKGKYRTDTEELDISLRGVKLNLEELHPFVPYEGNLSWLCGELGIDGSLCIDFREGIKRATITSDIALSSKRFSKGAVAIESVEPLHCEWRLHNLLRISGGALRFTHGDLWASCSIGTLEYIPTLLGTGLHLTLPPEMALHLAQAEVVPRVASKDKALLIANVRIPWENQIDADIDFTADTFQCELKDGFYWFGEKSWHIQNFSLGYRDALFHAGAQVTLDAHTFYVEGDVAKESGQLTVREEGQTAEPLVISAEWEEAFSLSRIEGFLCGLDIAFEKNAILSTPSEIVLTGAIKADFPALSPYFAKNIQEFIESVGIGSGYELRGDCVVPKNALRRSHFKGYLKGKHFELMGSTLQTLMSEITISPHQVMLTGLTLSDDAGIFSVEQMECLRQGDGHWAMRIPVLTINDFRPSLLHKIGKYRGRMKPMIVRELVFSDIQGIIGDKNSFTGTGSLNFENSFKKETTLLDIPFEIIARLGLDTALLMPVQGHLEYQITNGRIYLTALSESYSDGKRSRFYLSPSRVSYIDFDGDIHVNIKMKQYVLLKVTEPFTLSIRGNLEKPKYALN